MWVCTGFLLCGALFVFQTPGLAQTQGPQWSTPVQLSGGERSAYAATMAIDSAGHIHVFWTENHTQPIGGEGDTLYYAGWDGQSWTKPRDIMVSPDNSVADFPEAAIDNQDNIYLAWRGGPMIKYVYLATATVRIAGSFQNWSRPVPSLSSSGQPMGVDIAIGPDNTLYACHIGGTSDQQVQCAKSDNGGMSWQSEVNLSEGDRSDELVVFPRVIVDKYDTVHATWNTVQIPGGWPPLGVYYAHSTDRGETWSAATQIAAGAYTYASVAVTPDKVLHAFWSGAAEDAGKFHARSSDGGKTWSLPLRIAEGLAGATTGWLAPAVDSSGTLHLVMSAGSSSRGLDEIYYTSWDGQRWAEPRIISGGGSGIRPRLEVSEGNVLNAVWEESINDENSIYYASFRTTAPRLEPHLVATATLSAQPSPNATRRTREVTATPLTRSQTPLPADLQDQPTGPTDHASALLIGVVPAGLLVFFVLGLTILRSRDRK